LQNKENSATLQFNMLGMKKRKIKAQDKDFIFVGLKLKDSSFKNNIKKEEQKNKP
jgi:hypothetical protein